MSMELVKIVLPPFRRVTISNALVQRADDLGISRAELPIPMTVAHGDQPSWNDIVEAAIRTNCTAEIVEIRFVPTEKAGQ